MVYQLSPIFGMYAVWVLAHYVSSHLYVYYCVPYTWTGVLLSPIYAPMPHCVGMRYMIYNGGIEINQMWWLIGIWLCMKGRPQVGRVSYGVRSAQGVRSE